MPSAFEYAMRCSHCGKCCQETEMELCGADISRLRDRDYDEGDFCFTGKDGVRRLRNIDGCCFFYDSKKNRCREYANRPQGCAIYPVILSDGEIAVDELCPEMDSLTEKEIESKGRRLRLLLETIDEERRLKSKLSSLR
jgi:Fe-S-cluster containining protein